MSSVSPSLEMHQAAHECMCLIRVQLQAMPYIVDACMTPVTVIQLSCIWADINIQIRCKRLRRDDWSVGWGVYSEGCQ